MTYSYGNKVKVLSGEYQGQIGRIAGTTDLLNGKQICYVKLEGDSGIKQFLAESLTSHSNRGGHRPNAGRKADPAKRKPETEAIRLPKELITNLDYLVGLDELIKQYEEESKQCSATNPRWQKMRHFLAEVENLKLIVTKKVSII